MRINFYQRRRRQSGQAMAEFIVAAATVLVSLFVLIPLIGKLIDIKFYTQQAARHVAWERTVWFDQDETPPDTEKYNGHVAMRSDNRVANSVVKRSFSADDVEFNYLDVIDDKVAQPRAHWTYRSTGLPMYDGSDGARHELGEELTPSLAYKAIDTFNKGMKAAINFIDVLGVLDKHFMTIAHEMENFYTPHIRLSLNTDHNQVNGMERWVFDHFGGQFSARSAILADGWIAQGDEHFLDRTDDYVPSTILDNAVVNTIFDLAGYIDPQVNDLDFGYVNTQPVPDAEVDCSIGFCEFDD